MELHTEAWALAAFWAYAEGHDVAGSIAAIMVFAIIFAALWYQHPPYQNEEDEGP